MLRRVIGLVLGLGGFAVLVSLGIWQLQRLDWKLGIIAAIEARIDEAPVPVPASPEAARDAYLPVTAEGNYTGEAVMVLSSDPQRGHGVQVIAVLATPDGRRLLVDRGYIPEAGRAGLVLAADDVTVTGNLLWPDDADSYTPPPDLGRGLWFSRNVEPIAEHLGAEPVLIVARSDAAQPGLTPRPITPAVRNDHLGYAITWFLLAAVWAVMTLALLWRNRHQTT
jgi:surfeit locus 1 family protein